MDPSRTRALPPGVLIRPYRDSDAQGVRDLFVNGQAEGVEGTPATTALRDHLVSLSSLCVYSLVAVGLGTIAVGYGRAKSAPPPCGSLELGLGFMLVLFPLVYWSVHRRTVRKAVNEYINMSLVTDMKDVGAYYMQFDRSPAKGDAKRSTMEAKRSMFWVVEERATGAIIGCVGVDGNSKTDPHSLELRRMVVADTHRRKGMGHLLVGTALNYVRTLNFHGKGQKISKVTLSTPTTQAVAIRMYERNGWEKSGTFEATTQSDDLCGWFSVTFTIQCMSLDLVPTASVGGGEV